MLFVCRAPARGDPGRGRGSALAPSPVKAAALELGLPVSDQVDDVLATGAELGVVVAFGRLIRPHVLERIPMVNLHFSLLPRWRGAAPVERAILAGDTTTGVCVMAVEEGLDTGGIYAQAEVGIAPEATLDTLRVELVERGTQLLLGLLRDGIGAATPQGDGATYAAKIDPAELQLDFARPAVELVRVVRVGDAYTFFRGRRVKVIAARAGAGQLAPGEIDGAARVGAGDGVLELVEVQPEGKGRIDARAWLNGARPAPGERFGA